MSDIVSRQRLSCGRSGEKIMSMPGVVRLRLVSCVQVNEYLCRHLILRIDGAGVSHSRGGDRIALASFIWMGQCFARTMQNPPYMHAIYFIMPSKI